MLGAAATTQILFAYSLNMRRCDVKLKNPNAGSVDLKYVRWWIWFIPSRCVLVAQGVKSTLLHFIVSATKKIVSFRAAQLRMESVASSPLTADRLLLPQHNDRKILQIDIWTLCVCDGDEWVRYPPCRVIHFSTWTTLNVRLSRINRGPKPTHTNKTYQKLHKVRPLQSSETKAPLVPQEVMSSLNRTVLYL